jgi:hypothetical protein
VNEPRKELAAYAVQKLFLDDTELVVPPIVAHCFPLAEYRAFVPDERASIDGTDCVLGFASYWLESVRTASAARQEGLLGGPGEGFWDAELFDKDAMYRRSVGNTNLLSYVIRHGDPHNAQFLIEQTPQGLRTYNATAWVCRCAHQAWTAAQGLVKNDDCRRARRSFEGLA